LFGADGCSKKRPIDGKGCRSLKLEGRLFENQGIKTRTTQSDLRSSRGRTRKKLRPNKENRKDEQIGVNIKKP